MSVVCFHLYLHMIFLKSYLLTILKTLCILQLRLSTELREGAQPLSCHHVLGVGHEYLKPSASHPTVVLLCFAYSSANKYPIAYAIYIPVFWSGEVLNLLAAPCYLANFILAFLLLKLIFGSIKVVCQFFAIQALQHLKTINIFFIPRICLDIHFRSWKPDRF